PASRAAGSLLSLPCRPCSKTRTTRLDSYAGISSPLWRAVRGLTRQQPGYCFHPAWRRGMAVFQQAPLHIGETQHIREVQCRIGGVELNGSEVDPLALQV